MQAGRSAATEAQRQRALAEDFERAAREARAAAARYQAAATTEARTAGVLAPLAAAGYHLLTDRLWPGTRRANVDLVLVGPGGVFIVDTKAWTALTIEADRIYRGQADVTEEFDRLRQLKELTQEDLAEVGLAPGEVRLVVVLAGRTGIKQSVTGIDFVGEGDVLGHISHFGHRLPTSLVDAVLTRAVGLFHEMPPLSAPTLSPSPIPAMVQDVLFDTNRVHDALSACAEKAPIEQWMVYLHPSQAKLTRRSYNGPSRIRGSAGTGKTVVGLHRAAHLARVKGGRILFTTYVRTLPEVMRNLLARFAPDVVDSVEFTGVHRFALGVLKERGRRLEIDPKASARIFNTAWKRIGQGSALERLRPDQTYWQDEIDRVIKGRGITTFEHYAALPRTGRRTQLSPSARQEMWSLYQAYDAGMNAAGLCDFADLVTLAEAEVRRRPLNAGYSAVIADETQDLSCMMVRLLHSLVGDVPDGLTLIGDGQQSIYPGGYTLSEAGISVTGRAAVLDINYRNTIEITSFAASAIIGDEFDDIEGFTAAADISTQVTRRGAIPEAIDVGSETDAHTAMVGQIAQLQAAGVGLGDIAVLCATNPLAGRALSALRKGGYPAVELTRYDGRTTSAIKVGTVKRAKGLEFSHVLLPAVDPALLAGSKAPQDQGEREAWDLARRELYVAMTRARDGLWLAVRANSRRRYKAK